MTWTYWLGATKDKSATNWQGSRDLMEEKFYGTKDQVEDLLATCEQLLIQDDPNLDTEYLGQLAQRCNNRLAEGCPPIVNATLIERDGFQAICQITSRHIRKFELKWERNEPVVYVETDSDGFSFEDMTKLSELFGTTKIDASSEDRSGGYCETCGYSYPVSILRIAKITKFGDL